MCQKVLLCGNGLNLFANKAAAVCINFKNVSIEWHSKPLSKLFQSYHTKKIAYLLIIRSGSIVMNHLLIALTIKFSQSQVVLL